MQYRNIFTCGLRLFDITVCKKLYNISLFSFSPVAEDDYAIDIFSFGICALEV